MKNIILIAVLIFVGLSIFWKQETHYSKLETKISQLDSAATYVYGVDTLGNKTILYMTRGNKRIPLKREIFDQIVVNALK